MRIVQLPSAKGTNRMINADLVTEIYVGPYPEDSKYTEVSIQFGNSYIEVRFGDDAILREFLTDLTGGQFP